MIVVEGSNKHGLEREYVEGTYWGSQWAGFSRLFANRYGGKRTVFEDAALLISNLALTDPNKTRTGARKMHQVGVKKLVIIAKELSDNVTGLLVNNNRAKTIESMVCANSPVHSRWIKSLTSKT